MRLNRRKFLQVSAGVATAMALTSKRVGAQLKPVVKVGNPLEAYPDRRWEEVYRDQYKYERSFTYCCSPNDTHQCRVRGFVRNGILMRIEQNYDHHKVRDLYGNQADAAWNPRMCLRGMTYPRRAYGPYRNKYPMIRVGWKQWADDGFPYLDKENREKYKMTSRGTDEFVRMTWDQTFTYLAKGHIAVGKAYSGTRGAQRLKNEGYQPEMIEAMGGSGPRTFKYRGGMGLLGVIGKYGIYRLANMVGLLDSIIRGRGPGKVLGGRAWSNYTWHGDQAPGHSWTHGMQTSDIDFADHRYAKLTIQWGKNLIENKMPEAHWYTEIMERGGTLVSIAPEYNPPATKADYWIPVRAGLSDIALFLGISKIIMDEGLVDIEFVKDYTDMPLLVRTDTLVRLHPDDFIPGYKGQALPKDGFTTKWMKNFNRDMMPDFTVWDINTDKPVAITREDIGAKMRKKNIDPALDGVYDIKLVSGKTITVMPLYEMYKIHLKDYDVDTTNQICHAPKDLIVRLARDVGTIMPVEIHYGEGINHYFHATMHNRASYVPLMLTGNVGPKGSGSHTWAGNYKAGNYQGSHWSGPGFAAMVAEDPFNPILDVSKNVDWKNVKGYLKGEEVSYWAHRDKALIVNTPRYGRKVFTGRSHMPTPTKLVWFVNVNVINNAKWFYELVFNTNNNVDMIVAQDIEFTGSCEYSDIVLAPNSWAEFESYEITSACSNPFHQIWGGTGIKPIFDTIDDNLIHREFGRRMAEVTGDKRFADFMKVYEGKAPNRTKAMIRRLFTTSTTGMGYNIDDIINGKYGEPGCCLLLFRTYPRSPFWEMYTESKPYYTPNGRIQFYNDEPEAIEYGENFIVHREGPEATPYLPNVIVSTNPYIRPDDYGIPEDEQDPDLRHVRNIKKPWSAVRTTKNFLWEKGYRFYCVTPKSRHTAHSSWATTDWNMIWNNNFGDPYRMDKRSPGVGEWQVHMNPFLCKDLGINDGDYIYCDANPADRPYMGWKPSDPRYKVARLMLRAKYNPAYPYHTTMMKHATWIATERTVKAHEERPDGRAMSMTTPYQSNFRYGGQQSITRSWLMPMHQTDSLFHKAKSKMKFKHGYEADNHAVNAVPKETLVKFSKAEDGGLHGKGLWEPVRTGYTPESPLKDRFAEMYLAGQYIRVKI